MQSFEENYGTWEVGNKPNERSWSHSLQIVAMGLSGVVTVAVLLLLLNFLLVLCR